MRFILYMLVIGGMCLVVMPHPASAYYFHTHCGVKLWERVKKRWGRKQEIDMAQCVARMSSYLHSGALLQDAWNKSMPSTMKIPEYASARDIAQGDTLCRYRKYLRCEERKIFDCVVAAVRFSFMSGAPLHDVCAHILASLTQAEQNHKDRTSALAGPRTSARILSVLPLVAVCGSATYGINVVHVVTHSLLGALCVGCGTLCICAGYVWSRKLIKDAHTV